MEVNEKMTFVELSNALDASHKSRLSRLICKKTGRTSATVWNWRAGKTQPTSILERRTIADCVNKVLGLKTTMETLFPLY